MGWRAAFRIQLAVCRVVGRVAVRVLTLALLAVRERPFWRCGEHRGRRAKGVWSLSLPQRAVLPYPTRRRAPGRGQDDTALQ